MLEEHVNMQFEDPRVLLRLPQKQLAPDVGANLATAAHLLNLVSGFSVCFYNAGSHSITERRTSGKRKGLLRGFSRWGFEPDGCSEREGTLYVLA
jgi:hypothetical protein